MHANPDPNAAAFDLFHPLFTFPIHTHILMKAGVFDHTALPMNGQRGDRHIFGVSHLGNVARDDLVDCRD